MELRAFEAPDGVVVAGWPVSAEESLRWCSLEDVSAEMVASWAAESDVAAYVMVEDGELAGYGELWLDDDEAGVELARLIVAPSRRGRGLGRRLVTMLTAKALGLYPLVFMRVHPDNTPALRCYAGAAFAPVPRERADEWNQLQPVPYVWLSYSPEA
jgi:ribosomal protein S18 acetylase RimI-like enzyme